MEPKKDVKTVEEDDSSEDDFGADFSEDELDSDEVFFQSKACHCSFFSRFSGLPLNYTRMVTHLSRLISAYSCMYICIWNGGFKCAVFLLMKLVEPERYRTILLFLCMRVAYWSLAFDLG